MIKRTFGEIAQMAGGTAVNGSESLVISGVSKDTRTIQAGNLYVPLIGGRFDGHAYAEEAFGKGAAASLWQRDHGTPPEGRPIILVDDALAALQRLAARYREQLPLRIVGITGSNGKTTTKDMVAAVLAVTYNVHKTEGNLNGDIGLPLMILQTDERTELAVLEMGMRGFGEIELLTQIAKPEAAVITMIGEAHMERLGSREGIAKAKLEILSGLKPGGLFVYNGEEPLLAQLLPAAEKPEDYIPVTFGAGEGNDLAPANVEMDLEGTRFTIHGENGTSFYFPMMGRHNVGNALAAIAVGRYFGLSDREIADGLKAMQPSGMRIEKLTTPNGLTILNDAFNASPSSVKASIRLLGELTGFQRKFVVLGDMLELGDEEEQFHREIGELLEPERFDYIFTFGPLSRYIAEAAAERFPEHRVRAFESKESLTAAIAELEAGKQDIVLVKGSRGMQLEDVVRQLMQQS